MSFPAQTTLQTAIGSGATTVTPVSAAGLTAPCYLVIEQEIIYCPTAISGGSFIGVTRGSLSTIAAAHAQYVAVYGLFSDLFPFTSSDGEFLNAIAAELNTIENRITTGGGGGVTAVSGIAPIASSGGTTPAISVAAATSAALGVVQPDGTIITVAGGAITVPEASSSTFGVVKVDGTTITATAGVISAASGGGTVTAVTGTAPIASSGGTSPDISVAAASSAALGVVRPDGTIITVAGGAITVPEASSSTFGVVKVDGTTITATAGVISAASGGGTVTAVTGTAPIASSGGTSPDISVAAASSAALGVVRPDGTIITVTAGAITVPEATSSVFGVVKVDGTTITAAAGVISATAAGTVTAVTGSAPIASSGGAAPNITVAAATSGALGVVRPDGTIITVSAGAITVPQASSSVFGVVKVDGTTITAAGGVISAVASGGGPTTQNVVTGSRSIGTVFQNTTGKPMWVCVIVNIPSGNSGVEAKTDGSNPPTTNVAEVFAANGLGNENISLSFVVLSGNFYELTNVAGTQSVLVWTEWF